MHFYFANFNGAETTTVVDCKQYDYRPYLRLQGLNVTSNVEVEFSLTETGGSAVTRLGILSNGVVDVPIPDFIVEGADSTTNYRAFAFVRLRDKDSAWTEYEAVLYFESRPKPEHFMPNDQNSMAELLNQVKVIADDKVTKPLTGKVGQALVVKNVGADGKPMEFEAKDVSGGSVSPQEVENAVGDYLTKNPINVPKNLSDLAEDTTHRVVTDVEKQTWNGKANQTEVRQLKEDLTAHKQTTHFDGNYDNLTNKPTIPDVSGLATKAELSGKADKSAIPTKLPNPQKLTFQGAVTAEYDGSGAVTVTIPQGGASGGSADVERIEKLATDTNVELEPNKLYIFPEMASLTYSLKAPTKNNIANEYHFVFKSGASATQLVHAVGVNIGSFKVEPNKIYEISIMENLLTSQSWAVV